MSNAHNTSKDITQDSSDSSSERIVNLIQRFSVFDTPDHKEKMLVQDELVRLGIPCVPYLLDALHTTSIATPWVIGALARIKDDRAVIPLIHLLEIRYPNKPYPFGTQVCTALGAFRDERAIQALIYQLKNGDTGEMRISAADALGTIGTASVINPLGDAVQHDAYSQVREIALWALAKIGGSRTVFPMLPALDDKEEAVRRTATIILSQNPASYSYPVVAARLAKAAEHYIRQLASPSPNNRHIAASTLGQMRSKEAVAALKVLIETGNDQDVAYATRALNQIDAIHFQPS